MPLKRVDPSPGGRWVGTSSQLCPAVTLDSNMYNLGSPTLLGLPADLLALILRLRAWQAADTSNMFPCCYGHLAVVRCGASTKSGVAAEAWPKPGECYAAGHIQAVSGDGP